MIVEVTVAGEEQPHRYQLRHEGDLVRVCCCSGSAAGRSWLIDWREPEPGMYSLLIGGRSYEVVVRAGNQPQDPFTVRLLQESWEIKAVDARRHQATAADSHGGRQTDRIKAPMPGRVVKLLRRPGATVRQGDGIIVLEAMKMENELKAPRDGTLTRVHVHEGEAVDRGTVLASLE